MVKMNVFTRYLKMQNTHPLWKSNVQLKRNLMYHKYKQKAIFGCSYESIVVEIIAKRKKQQQHNLHQQVMQFFSNAQCFYTSMNHQRNRFIAYSKLCFLEFNL